MSPLLSSSRTLICTRSRAGSQSASPCTLTITPSSRTIPSACCTPGEESDAIACWMMISVCLGVFLASYLYYRNLFHCLYIYFILILILYIFYYLYIYLLSFFLCISTSLSPFSLSLPSTISQVPQGRCPHHHGDGSDDWGGGRAVGAGAHARLRRPRHPRPQG